MGLPSIHANYVHIHWSSIFNLFLSSLKCYFRKSFARPQRKWTLNLCCSVSALSMYTRRYNKKQNNTSTRKKAKQNLTKKVNNKTTKTKTIVFVIPRINIVIHFSIEWLSVYVLCSRRGAPTSGDVDILITHPNFDESSKSISKVSTNACGCDLCYVTINKPHFIGTASITPFVSFYWESVM